MQKFVLYGLITIFSAIGSWVPSLWHAGFLSGWGLLGGFIGCVAGVWINHLIKDYVEF